MVRPDVMFTFEFGSLRAHYNFYGKDSDNAMRVMATGLILIATVIDNIICATVYVLES